MFTNIKNFCSVKTHVLRMKRQATDLEKTFANYITDKGIAFRIYKELKIQQEKKQSNQKMGKAHKKKFHQRGHTDGK